jgi:hypothetical protein
MISSFPPKSLNRPLAIAAAAMLLQAGGAFAADLPHDAQTQARELLSGRPASRTASVSDTAAATGDAASARALEPQDQARRLILGSRSVGAEIKPLPLQATAVAPSAVAPAGRRAHVDALELARRMILGRVG